MGLAAHWRRLPWTTRLFALGIFAAILCWQARYTSYSSVQQYGWPMSFKYLDSLCCASSQTLLIADLAVWLTLAGSTGYVVNRWWQCANRFPINRSSVTALIAVVGVLLAMGFTELYLLTYAHGGAVGPRYIDVTCLGRAISFDIGLFSDPIASSPLARAAVILGIGCTVYSIGILPCRLFQRWRGHVQLSGGLSECGTQAIVDAGNHGCSHCRYAIRLL